MRLEVDRLAEQARAAPAAATVSPAMKGWRSSIVENSGANPYGAPVPIMNSDATTDRRRSAARQLSRTVLP